MFRGFSKKKGRKKVRTEIRRLRSNAADFANTSLDYQHLLVLDTQSETNSFLPRSPELRDMENTQEILFVNDPGDREQVGVSGEAGGGETQTDEPADPSVRPKTPHTQISTNTFSLVSTPQAFSSPPPTSPLYAQSGHGQHTQTHWHTSAVPLGMQQNTTSYYPNQQFPIRTVHHALDSFKKFDGRQANLETWLENAQTIAAREGYPNDDLVLMSAARSLIDFNVRDNPAVLVHDNQDARDCRTWRRFKDLYRKGCAESTFDDVCDAVARFMDFKSDPSQTEVGFL